MATRTRPPSAHFHLKMIFLPVLVLGMSGITDAKSKRIADPDIPQTSFSCEGRHNGYYADVETDCRVYHMCLGHEQFSYLCPNTTRFQQRMMVCDHWYQVDCPSAPLSYSANLLIGQRDQPFVPDHEHPALHSHSSAKFSQKPEGDNQPPPQFAPQPEQQFDRSPAPQPQFTQTRPTAQPQFFQSNPTKQPQFFQSNPTAQPQFIQSRQTSQQQTPTQPPFSPTPQRVIQQTQPPRFVSTPTPQPLKSQQSQLQFVAPPQRKQSDTIREKPGNQREVHSQFVPVFRSQQNELSDRHGKSLTTRPTSPTPSVELEAPLEDPQSPPAFFQRSPTSSFAQPYNVVSTTTRSPPTTSVPLTFTAPPSSSSTQRFTYKFSPSPVSSFQPVFQSTTPQPTTTPAPVTSPSTAAAPFSPSPTIPDIPLPSRELLPPFLDDPPKDDLLTSPTAPPANSPSAPETRQPTPRRIADTSSNAFLPDTPPPPSQELLPPELPNEALLPRPFGSLTPEGLSLFASTSGRTVSTTPQTVFEASSPQPQVRSTPQPTRQTPQPVIKGDEPSRELQAPEENDENFNTVEVKYQDVRKLFFIPRSSSHLPKEDPNQYTVVIKYPTADSKKSTSTMRFKTYSQSVVDRLNPSCPRCHPDFVVPGTCHPCVLLR